jgi:hypothetical protein
VCGQEDWYAQSGPLFFGSGKHDPTRLESYHFMLQKTGFSPLRVGHTSWTPRSSKNTTFLTCFRNSDMLSGGKMER